MPFYIEQKKKRMSKLFRTKGQLGQWWLCFVSVAEIGEDEQEWSNSGIWFVVFCACLPFLPFLPSFCTKNTFFFFSLFLWDVDRTKLSCTASHRLRLSLLYSTTFLCDRPILVRIASKEQRRCKDGRAKTIYQIQPVCSTLFFGRLIFAFCFSTHKTLNVIIHGHLVIPLLLFIYFIYPTMVFEVSIFANGLFFQLSIKRLTHCAKPSREQSVRLWGIGLAIFPWPNDDNDDSGNQRQGPFWLISPCSILKFLDVSDETTFVRHIQEL